MYLVDWDFANLLVALLLICLVIIPIIAMAKMFGSDPKD